LAVGDPAHPAVFVVIYFSIRSSILSAGLHYYIVAVRNKTMGRIPSMSIAYRPPWPRTRGRYCPLQVRRKYLPSIFCCRLQTF
jgi:hypothetical protein